MDTKILSHQIYEQYAIQILSTLPYHIYLKDKEGIYLYCNDAQAKFLGYDAGTDIVGKTDFELAWEYSAAQMRALDVEVMRSGKTYETEEESTIAGERIIFLSKKLPFIDKKTKKTIGILGVSIDITERKKQEELVIKNLTQLKEIEAKRREFLASLCLQITGHIDKKEDTTIEEYVKNIQYYFEHIIALMPGHVYWKDRNGIYLGCNDGQAKTLGYHSGKEIVGKTDFDLPWKAQAAKLQEFDKRVITTGENYVAEEPVDLPGNVKGIFLSKKVPMYDQHSKNIIGILGISFDITKQKNLENQLKAANALKSEFIQNMEHDIRTPTAGIQGMANLLSTQYELLSEEEKRKTITLLHQSATRLLDYCNQLLDFSRIEYGTQKILEKRFNLFKLLNDIIELEKPAACMKKIDVKLIYEDDTPYFFISDEFRIQRILMNLIGNAIKFTDKGSVKIAVKCLKKSEKNNVTLKITVSDTGIGIPKDKQHLIYEKFMRIEPSNRGHYRGTGLGLRIVKNFIDELNGEIYVESQIEKGSTFTCLLPMKVSLMAH